MDIYHNDLKLKHFLVLRDVITPIDFGKASLYIQLLTLHRSLPFRFLYSDFRAVAFPGCTRIIFLFFFIRT